MCTNPFLFSRNQILKMSTEIDSNRRTTPSFTTSSFVSFIDDAIASTSKNETMMMSLTPHQLINILIIALQYASDDRSYNNLIVLPSEHVNQNDHIDIVNASAEHMREVIDTIPAMTPKRIQLLFNIRYAFHDVVEGGPLSMSVKGDDGSSMSTTIDDTNGTSAITISDIIRICEHFASSFARHPREYISALSEMLLVEYASDSRIRNIVINTLWYTCVDFYEIAEGPSKIKRIRNSFRGFVDWFVKRHPEHLILLRTSGNTPAIVEPFAATVHAKSLLTKCSLAIGSEHNLDVMRRLVSRYGRHVDRLVVDIIDEYPFDQADFRPLRPSQSAPIHMTFSVS